MLLDATFFKNTSSPFSDDKHAHPGGSGMSLVMTEDMKYNLEAVGF